MVEEAVVNPNVQMEGAPVTDQNLTGPAQQEDEVNQEEQLIAQVIQLIAGLSAESQRQLMGFLNEQFNSVMTEETEEYKASPEEQARKADVMSEVF